MLGRTTDDKVEKQKLFLQAYRDVGTIRRACEILDISERIVYMWRKDSAFQEEFKIAKRSFADSIENLAIQKVQELRPNDNPILLITLLNGNRPDKYRPKNDQLDEDNLSTSNPLREIALEIAKDTELFDELQAVKKELEETKLLLEGNVIDSTSVIDVTPPVKPTGKPRPFKTEAQVNQELEERTQAVPQSSAPLRKPNKAKPRKTIMVDAPKIKMKRW